MDSLPCTILIPCAGASARFSSRISMPKALLQFSYKGKYGTMLDHIVPKFESLHAHTTIICRDSQADFFNSVPYRIQTLNHTIGQADTVRQGAPNLPGLDFLVINCDNAIDSNELESFVYTCRDKDVNVGAMVLKATSERYGYVDDYPYFIAGAEKAPISAYALAGAFYFRNASVVRSAYAQAVPDYKGYGREGYESELYLSQLFRYMPAPKLAYLISKDNLHEWGTPEQLEADESVRVSWP